MMLSRLCVMTMNRQMSTPHLFFDNSNPGATYQSPGHSKKRRDVIPKKVPVQRALGGFKMTERYCIMMLNVKPGPIIIERVHDASRS
jgi:hypothetical protein